MKTKLENTLRLAGFLALFLALALPAQAEELAVPDSYKACKGDAPYTTKTDLQCTFLVPIDRTNGQGTKDYFACQQAKPNWQFLKKFKCDFKEYDKGDKPAFARCLHDTIPNNFPRFHDDCRFHYYNPDYVFPGSFEACMKTGDHREDTTAELKKICSINISYVPETPGEVQDMAAANKFIEKCQLAGGAAEVVEDRYPECTLSFREKE